MRSFVRMAVLSGLCICSARAQIKVSSVKMSSVSLSAPSSGGGGPILNVTAGWHQVANTQLQGGSGNPSQCPPDNFPATLVTGGSTTGFTSYGGQFTSNCGDAFEDSSSAMLDTMRNRILFWQGGHDESPGQNEVYDFESSRIGTASPVFIRLDNPANPGTCPSTGPASTTQPPGCTYNSGGVLVVVEGLGACTYVAGCAPTGVSAGSRHTYENLAYLPLTDQLFSFGGGTAPQGFSSGNTWLLNMNSVVASCAPTSTNQPGCNPVWTNATPATSPLGNQTNYCSWDGNAGWVWCADTNDTFIWAYTPSTNTWAKHGSFTTGAGHLYFHNYHALDPLDQMIVYAGSDGIYWLDVSNPSSTSLNIQTPSTVNNCSLLTNGWNGNNGQYPGFVWDPIGRVFVGYPNGGNVLVMLDVSNLRSSSVVNCYTQTFGSTQGTDYPQNTVGTTTNGDEGTFGHFQYVPAYDIFALCNDPANDCWYFVPPRAGPNLASATGSSLTNQVVSVQQAFRDGDIPNYANAYCTNSSGTFTQIATTQTDVMNRWADGSLKIGSVSYIAPFIATGAKTSCRYQNESSGNNTGYLTAANMLCTTGSAPSNCQNWNFDAQIQLTGTASHNISARAILNAANSGNGCGFPSGGDIDGYLSTAGNYCVYWKAGPIVTCVILEDRAGRSFDVNTDGNTGTPLHPRFDVCFYPSTGQVEVGYTLEDMWASATAANSARSQTYSYLLTYGNTGPTTLRTQATETVINRTAWHHDYCTYGSNAGTQNGCDVGVFNTDHNMAYLEATKLFSNWNPNYTFPSSGSAIPTPSNFTAAWNNSATNKTDSTCYTGSSNTNCITPFSQGNDNGGAGFFPAVNGSCGDSNASTTNDQCSSGASNGGIGSGGAAYYHGPLTTWDVTTFMSQDPNMLNVVTPGNADAGLVIPYWFREADSEFAIAASSGQPRYYNSPGGTVSPIGRGVSINARTQIDLAENSASCGTNYTSEAVNYGGSGMIFGPFGDQVDTSHWPELAYLAYMMSGKYAYYEEMVLQAHNAIGNSLGNGSCYQSGGHASFRQGAVGYTIYNNDQDREVMWALREEAYGSTIALDGSPEQSYFRDKLNTNLASIEGQNGITCDIPNAYANQVNTCSGTLHSDPAAWTYGNTVRNGYPYSGAVWGSLYSGSTAYVGEGGSCGPGGTTGNCTPAYSEDSNFMMAYTAYTVGLISDLGFCPRTGGVCALQQWVSNYYINASEDPNGPSVGLLGDYVVPTINSGQVAITNLGCASTPCSIASGSIYAPYGDNVAAGSAAITWPRPVTNFPNYSCSDEGYPAEASAALSFAYGLTSTPNSGTNGTYNGTVGFSGASAFNLLRPIVYSTTYCAAGQYSPKWDITPR